MHDNTKDNDNDDEGQVHGGGAELPPDQVALGQVVPSQVDPDQVVSDQVALDEVAPVVPAESQGKKRKNHKDAQANKKPKVQENRAIFITDLPLDTDKVELEMAFKKYGIIDQGADGNKRIKMYTDEHDNFSGEALIVYFKKESVPLAIEMMDDYWFRISDQTHGKIRVKEADFSYKKNQDGDEVASKLSRKDRKAAERNRADLHRRLAEWSDNEEEVAATYAPKKNHWAKTVILKYAFTFEELDASPDEYSEVMQDVRSEAEKHGIVTNVTLFDKEEDGVMTVRFLKFDAAEAFCAAAHGRFFSARQLEATLAENKPKFKKTPRHEEFNSEDEAFLDTLRE